MLKGKSMYDIKTQIGDVRYNASEQCFEALVTFHTPTGRVRVAASFAAPMSTEFETASRGLWQSALDGLDRPGALQSRVSEARTVPLRSPRPRLRLNSVSRFFGKQAA